MSLATLPNTDLSFGASPTASIAMDTPDGSDNKSIYIGGGGSNGVGRGGGAIFYGNEYALTSGFRGRVTIEAGNAYTTGLDGSITFLTGNSQPRMVIDRLGNVGIGTTTPSRKLYVYSSATTGTETDLAYFDSEAYTTGKALIALYTDYSTDGNRVWYVDANGDHYSDGGFKTPADYAEYFYSDDTTLKSGELVSIAGNNKVRRCDKGDVLIGVVSTKPEIVGVYADDVTDAAEEYGQDPHYIKVGPLGQIPLKVSVSNGLIKSGDMLTVGENGVAVKGESPRSLLILALEDANQDGRIRALIK